VGIFRRVSDILTANVNDMLDRAENPEKLIRQVIREMDEAVQAAKRNVAQVIAGQKKLEKELQTNKRLCEEWQRKAQQAVEMDRDDLARTALGRKREHENLVATLEQQHTSGQQSVDNLRQTLKGLEAKLADAKRRKMVLVARKKTAEAQMAAQGNLARGADSSKAGSFARFERFEEQVDDLEAEAQALQEINEAEATAEAEFEGMDQGADIEIELEQLKRKVKGKSRKKK
jgi:phage shock protein A